MSRLLSRVCAVCAVRAHTALRDARRAPESPRTFTGDGEGGAGAGGAGDEGGNAGDLSKSPELKRLQSQLDEQACRLEAQAKRAEEAETARQLEALRSGVTSALTEAGADASKVWIALAHLQAEGLVKLDDNGAPCFVFQRDWGAESVSADKGAAEWLKTDAGQLFVAAKGAQGTAEQEGKTRA